MTFKYGDEISFDGSIDKTKEVYYSGIRKEKERDHKWHGEGTITRILLTSPHSHFRVTDVDYPYYVCDKLWETGDEEIPVNAHGVYIHKDEAILYNKAWNGTVINECASSHH